MYRFGHLALMHTSRVSEVPNFMDLPELDYNFFLFPGAYAFLYNQPLKTLVLLGMLPLLSWTVLIPRLLERMKSIWHTLGAVSMM